MTFCGIRSWLHTNNREISNNIKNINYGYKNTSKIVGKQDGKCVFQEEINPEVVMVCKLPMHINAKYADEQLKFLKSKIAVKNSYVDKINSDTRYCNLEVVK